MDNCFNVLKAVTTDGQQLQFGVLLFGNNSGLYFKCFNIIIDTSEYKKSTTALKLPTSLQSFYVVFHLILM